MDSLECAEILGDDGIDTTNIFCGENVEDMFADAKRKYENSGALYDDFSIEFMQLPAAALSVHSQSSATTDGMSDTNSSSRPPSVTMRSSSRGGAGIQECHRRSVTPTILDILRENSSSTSPTPPPPPPPLTAAENYTSPPARRLLVPNTDRPSTGTSKRSASGNQFSSITTCYSPLKRHRKDSSFVVCKPKASRQQDNFATRIGFDVQDKSSSRSSSNSNMFFSENNDDAGDIKEKRGGSGVRRSSRRKTKKKHYGKKCHRLQRVRPRVFTSPASESARLVQLRPETLCESPVEPSKRKQIFSACSPSHKESSSTVVLVTRPAKSFDRPWPVRKTAFRHCLSHLPCSSTTTDSNDENNTSKDTSTLTDSSTQQQQQQQQNTISITKNKEKKFILETTSTAFINIKEKKKTTSLYCPQPKRSTSPFMSLREVNERINSPTIQQTINGFSHFHDDRPVISSSSSSSSSGSFTVLPLSQSKKVKRQMEVVRGTRRIRTLIGETKLAVPHENGNDTSTNEKKTINTNTKSKRVRYRGSRRQKKK